MGPIRILLKAAALAVACSAGVGVLAGFYPAWRASRLDLVVALRNELPVIARAGRTARGATASTHPRGMPQALDGTG